MTTIVTRAGKGSALTHNEVDANFTNLNNAKYESGDSATLGASSISANTSTDALRITQTGTGNAFVVEDAANPDTTPFVIDAGGFQINGYTSTINSAGYTGLDSTGKIQLHGTTAGTAMQSMFNWGTAGSSTANIVLAKSKSGTIGTRGVVANNDILGAFSSAGDDGTNFITAASIIAAVDGTPGTNDMPGRLIFSTTADGASSPTERMRIDSAGQIATGGATSNGINFWNRRNLTGASASYGYALTTTIQSDVTSASGYFTNISTQAATFTTTNLSHYDAASSAFGAGSTVTSQFGFRANSSLTGATNNFGFYSNIAAATGRWNFYANGTAQNYFAGRVLIGSTTNINATSATEPIFQIHGTTAGTQIQILRFGDNAFGDGVVLAKSRGALGVNATVLNGDILGDITYRGADGTNYTRAASIQGLVDGTPGTDNMPGRLVFRTTTDGSSFPVERTRISSNGTLQHRFDLAVNNATVLTASYDSVSFSVAGQETAPSSITFRPDGLRMYILGVSGDDITQYTLTTAWDITTAGSPTTFSVASQDIEPQGMYFKGDGLQFYITGNTNDTVYQYLCSTAWDITTASYASKSFSVASQDATPNGIFFRPNGLKMYVIGSATDSIFEYDLGTAWDVTTAVYNNVSLSIGGQESLPQDLFFTNDGYKLFVIGSTGDDVNEYSLSRSWDITTATFLGVFSVASQDTAPVGLYINPNLSKFYIVGTTNDTVYQYSMGAGAINLTSDVQVNGKFSVNGTPPAAATSSGKQGDIIWDSGYIYICVEDNTWKRSAISTW